MLDLLIPRGKILQKYNYSLDYTKVLETYIKYSGAPYRSTAPTKALPRQQAMPDQKFSPLRKHHAPHFTPAPQGARHNSAPCKNNSAPILNSSALNLKSSALNFHASAIRVLHLKHSAFYAVSLLQNQDQGPSF